MLHLNGDINVVEKISFGYGVVVEDQTPDSEGDHQTPEHILQ